MKPVRYGSLTNFNPDEFLDGFTLPRLTYSSCSGEPCDVVRVNGDLDSVMLFFVSCSFIEPSEDSVCSHNGNPIALI